VAGSFRTLRMVRMVRLVRVLRIAKAFRHSEVITTVVASVVESVAALYVLVAGVCMGAIICATIAYALESDMPDTKFESIPAAMWWSLATITTVGYGDMVPVSVPGKIFGGLSMVMGMVIVSISVAVVTTHFTEVYNMKAQNTKITKALKRGGSVNVEHVLNKGRDVIEHIEGLNEQVKVAIHGLEESLREALGEEAKDANLDAHHRFEYAKVSLALIKTQRAAFFEGLKHFAGHVHAEIAAKRERDHVARRATRHNLQEYTAGSARDLEQARQVQVELPLESAGTGSVGLVAATSKEGVK